MTRVIYTSAFDSHEKDSWSAQILHRCGDRTMILFDDATWVWAYDEEMSDAR